MATKTRFALVVAALEVQFWFPVWLIFLLDRGFTIGQAAAVDGLFRVVATIAEVPAGYLSDRIGRKWSLHLALAGTTLTFFSIAGVKGLSSLVVAWVLWGILWALISGLLTAYAWEIGFTEPGGGPSRAAEYVRLRRIFSSLAMLFSLVSAGPLYAVRPSLPFVVTAILALAAIPVAARLPSPSGETVDAKLSPASLGEYFSARMRPALFAGAVVLVAGWSIQMVFQPAGLDAGLDPTAISILFAGFALAQLVGAWLVGRVRVGRTAVLVSSVSGIAVMCLGVWAGFQGSLPISISLVSLVLIGVFYSAGTTCAEIWVSELASDSNRATMLSLISLLGGMLLAVTRPLLGLVAGAHGSAYAFGMWAIVCGILAWVVWVFLGGQPQAGARVGGGSK